jgi:hypothetical protein
LQWLAKGVQSELEKIQRGTIGEYIELLKYTLTRQEKENG